YRLGVPEAPLSMDEAIPEDETGTTVTFYPSPDIFDAVVFDFETLRARFQQMAFLNKGLTITLTDERPPAEEEVEDDIEALDQVAPDDEAGRAQKEHRVSYRYDGG